MGLDIMAYSHLAFADCPNTFNAKGHHVCEDGDHIYVHKNKDFDRLDGRPAGCYLPTPETARVDFRAGSYSTYNHWRDQLSRLILRVDPEEVWAKRNTGQFAGRPFVELVDFSDCDGAFGPVTSAKLAKDFAEHAELVRTPAVQRRSKGWDGFHEYYGEGTFMWIYDQFQRAFALSAQDGFLIFC